MEDLLRAIGIEPTETMLSRYTAYLDAIEEANTRMNLTRIPREDAFHAHILDALAPVSLGIIPKNARLLDVGCGAGIPGVPIMIARSDVRATLIDGTKKKIAFVQSTCAALGLDAECLHARSEELAAKPGYAGAFDVVTARAVAPLKQLVPWVLPFLRKGGVAVLYKGPSVMAELAEAKNAFKGRGLKIEGEPVVYRVPQRDWERNLILLRRE